MIIDTTEETKIATKANKLLKLFKRILKYEYDETSRKSFHKSNNIPIRTSIEGQVRAITDFLTA
jgi:hypothetical protein